MTTPDSDSPWKFSPNAERKPGDQSRPFGTITYDTGTGLGPEMWCDVWSDGMHALMHRESEPLLVSSQVLHDLSVVTASLVELYADIDAGKVAPVVPPKS